MKATERNRGSSFKLLTCLIEGAEGVGKTSLSLRFTVRISQLRKMSSPQNNLKTNPADGTM